MLAAKKRQQELKKAADEKTKAHEKSREDWKNSGYRGNANHIESLRDSAKNAQDKLKEFQSKYAELLKAPVYVDDASGKKRQVFPVMREAALNSLLPK